MNSMIRGAFLLILLSDACRRVNLEMFLCLNRGITFGIDACVFSSSSDSGILILGGGAPWMFVDSRPFEIQSCKFLIS